MGNDARTANEIIAANAGQGPPPRMPEMLDYESIELAYETEGDTLFLTFGAARPGTTVDNPDGVWWRIDSETGEIYGIEIPGFEHYFLKHFTDDQRIAQHWRDLKAQNPQDPESRIPFATHILRLARLIDGHAPQASSREL